MLLNVGGLSALRSWLDSADRTSPVRLPAQLLHERLDFWLRLHSRVWRDGGHLGSGVSVYVWVLFLGEGAASAVVGVGVGEVVCSLEGGSRSGRVTAALFRGFT